MGFGNVSGISSVFVCAPSFISFGMSRLVFSCSFSPFVFLYSKGKRTAKGFGVPPKAEETELEAEYLHETPLFRPFPDFKRGFCFAPFLEMV